MRVIKTDRACHGGLGIFSIDIQPHDRRFATGGRAENGSGLVIIWDFKSVIENRNGFDKKPLPLCRLENHVGCVNCVRWSESGRFLASAGDDSIITIMHYAGKLASAAEDNLSSLDAGKTKNVEAWKCAHTLRGHAADVLHVAWSPGDLYLASCSIDNQIIIWHGQKFEKVTTLSGHQGLVKGVTWDPVGKFLASQSDDRTLRIWTTAGWTLKKTIREPFKECDATTQFLRLDWAPDGTVISSAHAMNKGGPVSKLIDRSGWEAERDFVGHRKAVTCTRWSPCIYEMTKGGSNKAVHFCICGVGSKDRCMSLWTTELQRPLAVLDDAFSQGLMDLSWSHNGRVVAACSSDGAILFVMFGENELGRILSPSEKESMMRQVYGKHGASSLSNGYANGHDASAVGSGASDIIFHPDFAKAQENQKAQSIAGTMTQAKRSDLAVANGPNTTTIAAQASSTQSVQPQPPPQQQKQTEIRTKDGKRRIQPVFLGSTIVTESAEDVVAPGPSAAEISAPLPSATTEPSSRMEIDNISTMVQQNLPEKSTASVPQESSDKQSNQESGTADVSVIPKAAAVSDTTTSFKNVQIKRKQGEAPTVHPSKKSRQQQQQQGQQKRNRRRISSSGDEDEPSISHSAGQDKREVEASRMDQASAISGSRVTTISLSVPVKHNVLTVVAKTMSNRGLQTVEVKCHNALRIIPNSDAGAKIVANQANAILWQTIVGSEILALAASPSLVAAAGCNRRLFVFKMSNGSRITPPLGLDSDISALSINGNFVMCLTSEGIVQVWDFEKAPTCLCKESLGPILIGSRISVSSGVITKHGTPVLTLSDGKSYTYNSDLKSWLVIFDPQDSLTTASLARTRSTMLEINDSEEPFAACLREGVAQVSISRNQQAAVSADSRSHPNDPSTMAVVAFLESQMRSAQELRSPQQYRFWFTQYIQHLAKEGLANNLKDICQELMDSAFASNNKKDDTILEFSKHGLLKEVLPIIATNAKLQRLYAELKEQMTALEGLGGGGGRQQQQHRGSML